MTSSDTITAALKADTPESEEIVALKAELAEIKKAQAMMTHNKRRRDGVSNNVAVTFQKCVRNHSGTCWIEGEQKREEVLALLREADKILASKKNKRPSSSEIKDLKAAVVANSDPY